MVYRHIKRHRYAIMVGVPVVFLLASSLSLTRDPEQVCVVPEDNRFVEVGEEVALQVILNADKPVNVVGGDIAFPIEYLDIESVSRDGSIIDLWSEEPTIHTSGTVHFSGGMVSPAGFTGQGLVLTLVARPKQAGDAEVSFSDVHLLAHDGTGMEVACARNPISLSIRPTSFPSPDVNGDSTVNIFDFGLVSSRLFMAYERTYDLNNDGKITLADIGMVISHMTGGTRMGSLALLWYL